MTKQEKIDLLKKDVTSDFDLIHLNQERFPVDMGGFATPVIKDVRVNNYLIKSNDDVSYVYGELFNPEFEALMSKILESLQMIDVDVSDRYCFVTYDQRTVKADTTMRKSGWHIDGLQGDEVPVKRKPDILFCLSNNNPTVFSSQKMDASSINLSEYNVFKWIENNINPDHSFQSEEDRLYGFSSYQLHKTAPPVNYETYRIFCRIAFSHVPITSTRTTLNNDIKYNYETHVTSGEIPRHLR